MLVDGTLAYSMRLSWLALGSRVVLCHVILMYDTVLRDGVDLVTVCLELAGRLPCLAR